MVGKIDKMHPLGDLFVCCAHDQKHMAYSGHGQWAWIYYMANKRHYF